MATRNVIGSCIAAALLATSSLGCGMSAAARAAVASLPANLQAGGKLVLYAPPLASCAETYAEQEDAIAAGGAPLHVRPGAQTPLTVTVVETRVEGSDVILETTYGAAAPQEPRLFLRVPTGKHSQCLWTDPSAYQAALQQAGNQVAFTPWAPSCAQLHAVGEGVSSVLLEADPVLTFEVTGVELGAAAAADYAQAPGGPSIWFALSGGSLKVRADTLDSCFTPQAAEAAEPPSFAALLATPLERCQSDGPADKPHVSCRTSLGVWEGETGADHVALRRTHRTLGAVHFQGGQPVDGAAFADTVVSVEAPVAESEHAKQLLAALEPAAREAMKTAAEDAVRLVEAGAPGATHRLQLEVTAEVGELSRRQVPQSSRYKKGEKTVDNPARPGAEERLALAKERLAQEEQSYQESKQQYDEAKDRAVQECRDRAAAATAEQKPWLNLSCDAGSIAVGFIQPSTDGIDSARQELNDASAHLAKTPPTLQEDIMDTWNYEKTVLRRSARGQLRLRLVSARGEPPREVTLPVSHDWEDYQVAADAYHNVQGHEPDSGPIDRPEALLGPLGNKLRGPAMAQLQAAIVNASLEAARRAFVEAGKAESKPGFEVVDAVAHQIAGGRIAKLVQRGKSSARSKAATVLPMGNAALAPGECLLAVAAVPLDESGWTELVMATRSLSHLDGRRRPVVSFEVCDYEVAGWPKIEVVSDKDTQLLWGLYATQGGQAGGLISPIADSGAATAEAGAAPVLPAPAAQPVASTPAAATAAPAAQPATPVAAVARPAALARPVVDESRLGSEGESCRARADCKSGLRCVAHTCAR